MAASLNTKGQLLDLQTEHAAMKRKHEQLVRVVSVEAPHLLELERPEPITEYTEQVPQAVLAMADNGLTEVEWIAELGITEETWKGWRESFPPLNLAISRARARLMAYLDRISREAVQSGRNNFPVQVMKQLQERVLSSVSDGDDSGDASGLIVIDLTCKHCAG